MFTTVHVRFAVNHLDDAAAIRRNLNFSLSAHDKGPVFIIGSWQTGDFCHIYAAAVRHFSIDPDTPFAMLVVVAQEFGASSLLADIEFAIKPMLVDDDRRQFTLYYTDPLKKSRAIQGISDVKDADNAREPYNATFWAEEAVQKMIAGQPLTPVWADLVRGEHGYSEAYETICMSFMQEYIKKFGRSNGREKFVCVWSRTSGAPNPGRELGGANPHYDSSEEGNHQLCVKLSKISSVKAVFIVGDGFLAETKGLPQVFDLGKFWTRQQGVLKGRFQENGFFDYMTAFYDCDVVHVGMKSGGMDTLGLWGQKVVFMDSSTSPEITRGRVAAWSTQNLLPLEISAMPTSMGKAIESARKEDETAFKTTFSSRAKVKKMAQEAIGLTDSFDDLDLEKISRAVMNMFDV